jgi:hypothetical protein
MIAGPHVSTPMPNQEQLDAKDAKLLVSGLLSAMYKHTHIVQCYLFNMFFTDIMYLYSGYECHTRMQTRQPFIIY